MFRTNNGKIHNTQNIINVAIILKASCAKLINSSQTLRHYVVCKLVQMMYRKRVIRVCWSSCVLLWTFNCPFTVF